jgi:quinol monooxygenase YgiN
VVWFYELYADKASADAHNSSEAFAKWFKSLASFVDGAPEFSFLTPIGGKGI